MNATCSVGVSALLKLEAVDVEKVWNEPFEDVLNDRFCRYDEAFIKNRDEQSLPARQICGSATDVCGVSSTAQLIWLCTDFLAHLKALQEEALASGLLT